MHCEPLSLFEFDSDAIQLELPKKPKSGWTMKHLNMDKMKRDDIVRNRFILPFQVRVSWIGSEGKQTERLEHELVLLGAKRHKIMRESSSSCRR
jgi:hypothetical protein